MGSTAEDIVDVFHQRKRTRMHLNAIYSGVLRMRIERNQFVASELEAEIRNTLQRNCKESKQFSGDDLFKSQGPGVWGIK